MNEERYKKLKASAQRYTAYRERTPKEVRDKLTEWSAPNPIIERIIDELKADQFIDEERFARAFCHDKFLINKWGKNRLRLEMTKYELSAEAKNQGLEYIKDADYLEVLEHLTLSKWEKIREPDMFKRKQKVARYLLQKGYESELVWEKVNAMD